MHIAPQSQKYSGRVPVATVSATLFRGAALEFVTNDQGAPAIAPRDTFRDGAERAGETRKSDR